MDASEAVDCFGANEAVHCTSKTELTMIWVNSKTMFRKHAVYCNKHQAIQHQDDHTTMSDFMHGLTESVNQLTLHLRASG